MVKLSGEDIADFEVADFDVLRDVAMATIFWLSIYGTWTVQSYSSGGANVHPVI